MQRLQSQESKMSLARAFTTRRNKQSQDLGTPQRSNTSRSRTQSNSIRSKISAPTELTHTTNMLAYNAPDLFPQSNSLSPSTPHRSDDDSSDVHSTAVSSPPTSPDMPSTPNRSNDPEPNHLSCYFTAPGQKGFSRPVDVPPVPPVPSIPHRAPSHTKKASLDNLNRQGRFSNQSNQTVSTQGSLELSRTSSSSTTATSVSSVSYTHKPPVPAVPPLSSLKSPPSSRTNFRRPSVSTETPRNPFDRELAEVSELAEELGTKDKLHAVELQQKLQAMNDKEKLALENDVRTLRRKGLMQLKPEDYVREIELLVSIFFAEPTMMQSPRVQAPEVPIQPTEIQTGWI